MDSRFSAHDGVGEQGPEEGRQSSLVYQDDIVRLALKRLMAHVRGTAGGISQGAA